MKFLELRLAYLNLIDRGEAEEFRIPKDFFCKIDRMLDHLRTFRHVMLALRVIEYILRQ